VQPRGAIGEEFEQREMGFFVLRLIFANFWFSAKEGCRINAAAGVV